MEGKKRVDGGCGLRLLQGQVRVVGGFGGEVTGDGDWTLEGGRGGGLGRDRSSSEFS